MLPNKIGVHLPMNSTRNFTVDHEVSTFGTFEACVGVLIKGNYIICQMFGQVQGGQSWLGSPIKQPFIKMPSNTPLNHKAQRKDSHMLDR